MSVIVRCMDCRKVHFEGKTSEIDAEYTGLLCEKCEQTKMLTVLLGLSQEVEAYWDEADNDGENMYDWVQAVIGDAIAGVKGKHEEKETI